MPIIYGPYTPKSHRPTEDFAGVPSRTQRHHQRDCDINFIVDRYVKTGTILDARGPGEYIDLSDVGDFRQSLSTIRAAGDSFDSLPSNVRRYFENDPLKYVDYCLTRGHTLDAVALGLSHRRRNEPTISQAPQALDNTANPQDGGVHPTPATVTLT